MKRLTVNSPLNNANSSVNEYLNKANVKSRNIQSTAGAPLFSNPKESIKNPIDLFAAAATAQPITGNKAATNNPVKDLQALATNQSKKLINSLTSQEIKNNITNFKTEIINANSSQAVKAIINTARLSIEQQIYTDDSLADQELLQNQYHHFLILANDKLEELQGRPHRGSNLLNPVEKVLARF